MDRRFKNFRFQIGEKSAVTDRRYRFLRNEAISVFVTFAWSRETALSAFNARLSTAVDHHFTT